MRQRHYIGTAAHILFHQPHRGPRFDVQSARIKANPFAHKRHRRRAERPPTHIKQSWHLIRGPTNRMYQRQIFIQQRITSYHRNFGSVLFSQRSKRCLQRIWSHVRCRRIDQITRQGIALGHCLDTRRINAIRRTQSRLNWSRVPISRKPVV